MVDAWPKPRLIVGISVIPSMAVGSVVLPALLRSNMAGWSTGPYKTVVSTTRFFEWAWRTVTSLRCASIWFWLAHVRKFVLTVILSWPWAVNNGRKPNGWLVNTASVTQGALMWQRSYTQVGRSRNEIDFAKEMCTDSQPWSVIKDLATYSADQWNWRPTRNAVYNWAQPQT